MLLDEKQHKYKKFVDKLLLRCQEVQNENERQVLRINTIKKTIRRRVRDVEILKRRLDHLNDNWRSLPMVAPHPKRKIEQKRGPKPKNKDNCAEAKEKKVRKQRSKKNVEDKATTNLSEAHDILEQTRYQESQAQQLLMMQQRQMNLKNDQLL